MAALVTKVFVNVRRPSWKVPAIFAVLNFYKSNKNLKTNNRKKITKYKTDNVGRT